MIHLLMATFFTTCEVLIGSFRFTSVNHIKVNQSWKEVVDTAVIRLPLLKGKINRQRVQESLADKIKAGDKVSVKMGYRGLKKSYEYEEFKGYVKYVSPNVPLEIECEDAAYLLRGINLIKTWRATTLKEVIQYIVDESNKVNADKITLSGKIPEVKMDKFRLDNLNGQDALQQVKEEYGLVAYFRDQELFVGLAFTEMVGDVKYSLAWNVIDSDLKYRKADEVSLKLKAVAILKDNKQISVEVGSKAGELRTQFYYNVSDKETLRKIALQDIDKLRFEGYEGNLTTFLVPFVRHSMTADIQDPDYEIRHGNYIVDEVETTFDIGIERKVTIGKKV